MRAADQVRAMGRGLVPATIEEALGRLQKPELSARDIIRLALAQKVRDAGNINDYKWFRRRPSYIYTRSGGSIAPSHRLYEPKKYEFRPRWICLLDTSGSMHQDDIARGVKELQLVADTSEGWIVPCDAVPYWNQATRVTSKTELTKTRVVGRGGTVFQQFFEELPKQRLADRFDLVIIITDGDCDTIPKQLMPQGADCLWILTKRNADFRPNFGRVAMLKK